jgi:hypothetical protein
MTTISASSTIGITLSSPSYTSPVVINPGVTISSNGIDGYSVSAPTGSWTIQNAGDIASSLPNGGTGIYLSAGGSVTNQSTGTISGDEAVDGGIGIAAGFSGALTVVNAGSIVGSFFGVGLEVGGTVSNQSSRTISGHYGISGFNTTFTVVNGGSIAGVDVGPFGGVVSGIELEAGGNVTNQSSGRVTGYIAIYGYGGASTIVNAGLLAGNVTGTSGKGVDLFRRASGGLTNQSTGTISGLTLFTATGLLPS